MTILVLIASNTAIVNFVHFFSVSLSAVCFGFFSLRRIGYNKKQQCAQTFKDFERGSCEGFKKCCSGHCPVPFVVLLTKYGSTKKGPVRWPYLRHFSPRSIKETGRLTVLSLVIALMGPGLAVAGSPFDVAYKDSASLPDVPAPLQVVNVGFENDLGLQDLVCAVDLLGEAVARVEVLAPYNQSNIQALEHAQRVVVTLVEGGLDEKRIVVHSEHQEALTGKDQVSVTFWGEVEEVSKIPAVAAPSVEPLEEIVVAVERRTPVIFEPVPVVRYTVISEPEEVALVVSPEVVPEPKEVPLEVALVEVAEPEPEVPEPEPEAKIFTLVATASLKENITRWCLESGWTLLWEASVDFPIVADASFKGDDMLGAIQMLVGHLRAQSVPLSIQVGTNQVIRITGGSLR